MIVGELDSTSSDDFINLDQSLGFWGDKHFWLRQAIFGRGIDARKESNGEVIFMFLQFCFFSTFPG